MAEPETVVYILYNANASVLGKLDYARRKLTASASSSPCAACDLTHGGLKLDESAKWKQTKQRINASVKQLHRDELDPQLRDFVTSKGLHYPMVLGQKGDEPLKVLIDSSTLPSVSDDHEAFLSQLRERAVEEDIPLTIS